jgi:hypothetical protein
MRTAFLVGLVLSGALRATLSPADPCAVLKQPEIQALAASAKVGATVPTTLPAGMGANCRYTWSAGANAAAGLWELDVAIGEAAKLSPGTDPATLKEGLAMQAKSDPSNASLLPGVGEAAVYTSESPIRVSTTAYVKGRILRVDLEGPTARTKKDQVIALLKTAAGRL